MVNLRELSKVAEGQGEVRRLAAGHSCILSGHARFPGGENAFKALWVELGARNNFDAQITGGRPGRAGHLPQPPWLRVRGGGDRAARDRPAPCAHGAPAADGDRGRRAGRGGDHGGDHQVRVRFAWQRGRNANPGGLAHDLDPEGNAPGDDRSGTWLLPIRIKSVSSNILIADPYGIGSSIRLTLRPTAAPVTRQ
jgi:type VI secretion system secreted protein VgrG